MARHVGGHGVTLRRRSWLGWRLEAGVWLCVVTLETVSLLSAYQQSSLGLAPACRDVVLGRGQLCSAVCTTLARQRERVLQTGTEEEENNV